jgi:hypothetical protein
MANFKVGQRFRYIAVDRRSEAKGTPVPVGITGLVVGIVHAHPIYGPGFSVLFDKPEYRSDWYDGSYFLEGWQMAPATDPRASEFIEDMERFSRVAPKIPARV